MAQQFAETFSSLSFTKFEAVGGYLNAHINKTDFIQDFFSSKIQNSKLKIHLSSKEGNSKSKVMIEYMSANPNKPLHI